MKVYIKLFNYTVLLVKTKIRLENQIMEERNEVKFFNFLFLKHLT